MIRPAVRFAVAAFCLLSLLAALGACWLWWEYAHSRGGQDLSADHAAVK
jgi:hypothetical protein